MCRMMPNRFEALHDADVVTIEKNLRGTEIKRRVR
jgi:hypothetical protein